ncbi:MAG: glutathione S-transferase family protein [Polyangiaceae bacterium]
MTKIWGRRGSSSVQKVIWTLAELSVQHERIDAGYGFGVIDTPEYLAKNPNGTVPTLEEPDGFVLWESNAIVRYLAKRYGAGSLAPADLRQYARSESWMDWASITFEPSLSKLWQRLVLNPLSPVPDPAVLTQGGSNDELIAKVAKGLAKFAAALPKNGYLQGEALTIGDIPIGQLVSRWYKLPISHPELPRIRDYHELLSTRQAYRDHVVAARPLT